MNFRFQSAAAKLLSVLLVVGFCQWNAASAAGRSAMLISPDALHERLQDKNLRVLDIRPEEEYLAGHVPGAVRVDLAEWKAFTKTEGALKDASAWAERVGALGIGPETKVVVYGTPLNEATRVWWILEYLGHAEARLLNGGWQSWQAEGQPAETEVPKVAKAEFVPQFQPERLAEIDQIKQWLTAPGVAVLDARTEEEYTGEKISEGNPRGGHLPGAIHLNWEDLTTRRGRFKSPGRLKKIFAAAGVSPDQTVVTHCQSGGRAAAEAFALELAGYRDVRNFYCSFQEWSGDEQAPVEQGK